MFWRKKFSGKHVLITAQENSAYVNSKKQMKIKQKDPRGQTLIAVQGDMLRTWSSQVKLWARGSE